MTATDTAAPAPPANPHDQYAGMGLAMVAIIVICLPLVPLIVIAVGFIRGWDWVRHGIQWMRAARQKRGGGR